MSLATIRTDEEIDRSHRSHSTRQAKQQKKQMSIQPHDSILERVVYTGQTCPLTYPQTPGGSKSKTHVIPVTSVSKNKKNRRLSPRYCDTPCRARHTATGATKRIQATKQSVSPSTIQQRANAENANSRERCPELSRCGCRPWSRPHLPSVRDPPSRRRL